jgi:putative spermidine/putrescine transport system permease protein
MSSQTLGVLRAYAILVAILILAPLAVAILASLTADGFMRVPPVHWGTTWYAAALADRTFLDAFKFNLIIAPTVAVLSVVLGVSSSIALYRFRFAGRELVHGLIMAPLMLPHILIAIGLLQLFATFRVSTSPYGLIAGHVVITVPFVVRLVMAGMAGLDPLLEHASYSLGASRFYTLRRVTVPLIGPAVMSALVFALLISFDETTIAIFMAVPGSTTLPVQIFSYAQNRSDPLIAAVSSMMVALGVVVIVVVDRAFGLLRLLSGRSS